MLLKLVGWLVAATAFLTAAVSPVFTSLLPQPAPSREKTLSWCCRRLGENLKSWLPWSANKSLCPSRPFPFPCFLFMLYLFPKDIILSSIPTHCFYLGVRLASMNHLSHSLTSFQGFVYFCLTRSTVPESSRADDFQVPDEKLWPGALRKAAVRPGVLLERPTQSAHPATAGGGLAGCAGYQQPRQPDGSV